MNKILRKILLLFGLLLFYVNSTAQLSEKVAIPKQHINKFIDEVYLPSDGQKSTIKPHIRSSIYKLLSERVYYITSEKVIEKASLLSAQPLFKKYNPDLSRDLVFDPNLLNPLKYDLPYWKPGASYFRLDNTSYYLVIEGQNFSPKN